MGNGFRVDIEALKTAGLATAELMDRLSRHRIEDVDCAPEAVGDEGLATSLAGFCDRWQLGIAYLTEDGHQLAQHLIDAAGTYLEADQHACALLGGQPDYPDTSPGPVPAPGHNRPVARAGGGPVAAAELGDSGDPRALIPGDPAAVAATAAALGGFAELVGDIGSALTRLDSGGWEGAAGEAFDAYLESEPKRWVDAGDALEDAASALETYSFQQQWAQEQAREAIALWNEGQAASAETASANASGAATPDPGQHPRDQAHHLLQRARSQIRAAAEDAAAVLSRAAQHAPERRTLLVVAWAGLAHTASAAWDGAREGLGALVRGTGEGLGQSTHAMLGAVGSAAASVPMISGATVGGALRSLGLDEQGATWEQQGKADGHSTEAAFNSLGRRTEDGLTDATDTAGDWIAGSDDDHGHYVLIDPHRYPETATHMLQAQEGHSWDGDAPRPGWNPQPAELTIDRSDAEERRSAALRAVPERAGGVDRDEYPPAMFDEGGQDASVKYIDSSDNRGAGATTMRQIQGQGLGDGDSVRIVVG